MASEYYGLNRGANANPDEVTVGTSTGSTDVELRIDKTKSLTKEDVRVLVSTIIRRIVDGRYDEISG